MKKVLKIDNERLVPEKVKWYQKKVLDEHLQRYLFALRYIEKKKVLDIACGTGYGAKIFALNGAKKVIGIDNNIESIKYAKKNYSHKKITYIIANAESIPLPDFSIDVVVSFETIEHLKRYKTFLEEVYRVLKKGGVFIVSSPERRASSLQKNPFHIKEFTLFEITKLLKKYYKNVEIYVQKPISIRHISFSNVVSKFVPSGFLRWFADSAVKILLKSSKVKNIKNLKHGQLFTYLVLVAHK